MSWRDSTREQNLYARQTVVRDSRQWEWGPFAFSRIDYGTNIYRGAGLTIFGCVLMVGLTTPP